MLLLRIVEKKLRILCSEYINMLTEADYVYYFVYVICLVLSFWAKRKNLQGLQYLRITLCLGFLNEMCVEVMQFLKLEENFSHFIYIPSEYCLLCLFYLTNTSNKWLKKLIQ